MVGGERKYNMINGSKGLIFPVKWHEPFGLAIIESMYYGCPVFGTPYGALPELVTEETGYLSRDAATLARAIEESSRYLPRVCQDYAIEHFNSKKMAESYLERYEQVLEGKSLNEEIPKMKDKPAGKFLEWTK
jgi:glycosyltransferase involved in cell wall biosynthesis